MAVTIRTVSSWLQSVLLFSDLLKTYDFLPQSFVLDEMMGGFLVLSYTVTIGVESIFRIFILYTVT